MDISSKNLSDQKYLIDLGNLPVPGYLCDTFKQAITEPTISNCLKISPRTNLIHQEINEESKELLNKKVYSNYQSTYNNSFSLNSYMKSFIDFILQKTEIQDNENILEVGSNNGHIVKEIASKGFNAYGVDPSSPNEKGNNYKLINGFFGEEFVYKNNFKSKFKLVYTRHTLEHVYDPFEFVEACSKCISKKGKVIIEVPYSHHQIERNHFEGISIQHQSFFTITSLKNLAENANLFIEEFLFVPMDGGSIIVVLSKDKESKSLSSYLSYEKSNGFFDGSAIKNYASKLSYEMKYFRQFIDDLSTKGIVCGYGAGSKGSIFYNAIGLDKQIDFIIDDVQVKSNIKYMPGCGIKVLNKNSLGLVKPNYIVISAPTHIQEIRKKINSLFPEAKIIISSPYFGFLDQKI